MSKEISLATVKEHNKTNDLWVIIENKVYDLTKFLNEHPGGEDALIDVAGRDGTKDFISAGHSEEAREMMKKFYVGDLAASDIKKKCPVNHNSDTSTPTPTSTVNDTDMAKRHNASASASNEPAPRKQCCILH